MNPGLLGFPKRSYPLVLQARDATDVPLTVVGAPGQTAKLASFKDSAGVNLVSIGPENSGTIWLGALSAGVGVRLRSGANNTLTVSQFSDPNLSAAITSDSWSNAVIQLASTSGGQVNLGSGVSILFGATGLYNATKDVGLKRSAAGILQVTDGSTGSGKIKHAGSQAISTGAAPVAGEATLVGGTVTVNTTAATSTALIFTQRKTAGGTIGFSTTITRVAGTSFTITSDNALDTSVYMWQIVEVY